MPGGERMYVCELWAPRPRPAGPPIGPHEHSASFSSAIPLMVLGEHAYQVYTSPPLACSRSVVPRIEFPEYAACLCSIVSPIGLDGLACWTHGLPHSHLFHGPEQACQGIRAGGSPLWAPHMTLRLLRDLRAR